MASNLAIRQILGLLHLILACVILVCPLAGMPASANGAEPTIPSFADLPEPPAWVPASRMVVRTFRDEKTGKLMDQVVVTGRPPKHFRAPVAVRPQLNASSNSRELRDVPAFDWCYGCSATSAAMIMGYYDNQGYDNMYAGPTNSGLCPMTNSDYWGFGECPLSATHMGVDGRLLRGHVDDYYIEYLNTDPDPYIAYGWAEHAQGDCTGDYMGTSQSKFGRPDGWTSFNFPEDGSPSCDYTGWEPSGRDGCHGLRLFVESRGYAVLANCNQYIEGYRGNILGFTYSDFKAEIDAGRPVLIHVTDHTVVGWGYNEWAGGNDIYIHDTWDTQDHMMTWGGSYFGRQHCGVTCLHITKAYSLTLTSSPFTGGTINASPEPNANGKYISGTVVTLTATPNTGYTFTNWSGGTSGSSTTTTITMDGDKSVRANFTSPGPIVAWGMNTEAQCNIPYPNADVVGVGGGDYHSVALKLDGSIVAWGDNSVGQCDVPPPNTEFVGVAAGPMHNLGLKSDGSIVAWGLNDHGQCNVPSPNTGFVAVAAGLYHSLGLKSDGSIGSWGWDVWGQCSVPEPNRCFVAIAAGRGHSLGLKSNGSVVAWGDNGQGQCNVPSPNTGTVAIAAGGYHTLRLKSDGLIETWGSNSHGQCSVPDRNMVFVAVAGGCYHSLALKPDGSIVAWGRDDLGQCDVPSPNSGFAAITGGWLHSIGLKAPLKTLTRTSNPSGGGSISATPTPNGDGKCTYGTVVTLTAIPNAGYAFSNWSGDATGSSNPITITMNGDKNVTANFTQLHYALTLTSSPTGAGTITPNPLPDPSDGKYASGTVITLTASPKGGYTFSSWCGNAWGSNTTTTVTMDGDKSVRANFTSPGAIVPWGRNTEGQCNVAYPNADVVAVGGGDYHSVALKLDGSIVAWGDNSVGQCDVPPPNTGFTGVAVGPMHNLGLKSDGSIVTWGDNSKGQCSVPSPNTGFIAVAAGLYHSLGLKTDGSIVAWGGDNVYGECNVPAPNTGFVAIAAGRDHCLGLKSDGSIVAWGKGEQYQCNVPSPNTGFVAIAAGGYHSLGLKSDGSIEAWGASYYGFGQCSVPPPNSGFVAVAGGCYHSLGLKSDGSIVAWGRNDSEQCDVPLPNSGFAAVAGGWLHSVALKRVSTTLTLIPNPSGGGSISASPPPDGDGKYTYGTVVTLTASPNAGYTFSNWTGDATGSSNPTTVTMNGDKSVTANLISPGSIVAWGNNDSGQCNVPSPNTEFVAVAWGGGGGSHNLGLKSDGSIVAWGEHNHGECNVPSPNTGFVGVARGGNHSLGLKSDGSIVAWGRDGEGQCSVPSPNTGFVGVAGGYYHSLGLKSDGSVVAWGRNSEGQCNVPSANTGFVAVAAGWLHSLGVKSDGSVVAWGRNSEGQCNVPSANTGFVAVAAGDIHSLGLKSDGSVVAWGDNDQGQCLVPSPNTGFVAIASGSRHNLGVKSDGSIVAWGLNDHGQCNVPSPNTGFVGVAGGSYHSVGLAGIGHALTLTLVNSNYGMVGVLPNLPKYPEGSTVTLIATPIEGKSFRDWTIWSDPNRYPDPNHVVVDSNVVLHLTIDHDYAVEATFKCGSGLGGVLPLAGVGLLTMVVVVARRRRR